MFKFKKMVLMLSLILSGAFCYAHGVARQENEKGKDGTPIEVIKIIIHGSSDKSGAINPIINGQVLTVVFTEDLGQVVVELTTSTGSPVDGTLTITPNGIMFYIPLAGNYIVNFTLSNGDEYYGEFTVTD